MDATPRRRVERAMSLTNGKPVEQFKDAATPGPRACGFPGCGTRLSRYNPNTTCTVHGGWLDADQRRNRDIL